MLILYMEEINNHQRKNSHKFYCKCCDFSTSRLSHYNNHLKTKKHINNSTGNFPQQKSYECEFCGNIYKDRSGLHRHSKKCNVITNTHIEEKPIVAKVIDEQDENKKNIEKLTEQVSNLTQVISGAIMDGKLGNTTNNNITNNNTFNLNIFLNENCRDAMNITDFVDQIKLQLIDFENQGKLGYVGGISNILIKNLEELDVTQRPIHCTDPKRETLYVKDNGVWEKGDKSRDKVIAAIDTITKNNTKQYPEWIKQNPSYRIPNSEKSDEIMKISNNLGGGTNPETEEKNLNKIVKNIARGTIIDKKGEYN